jgi:uncharacterized protein (DUF305 family)
LAKKIAAAYTLNVAAALLLSVATAQAQQDKAPAQTAPIVQPGAPGKPGKVLPPTTTAPQLGTPSEADIAFMQGMIMHHNQAVEMTAMMPSRSKNPKLLELGQRISISQTDEMVFMKQWLQDRGLSISDGKDHMAGMAGMKDMPGMDMSDMPPMPGMLTAKQMDALRKATGPEFDHLFLTGMIQHHTGALTMVKDLFKTPGAGQDAMLFDFTSDVDNVQQAEIDTMRHMLAEEKK